MSKTGFMDNGFAMNETFTISFDVAVGHTKNSPNSRILLFNNIICGPVFKFNEDFVKYGNFSKNLRM